MWNTNEDKNSMFLFVYRWQFLRFLSSLIFHIVELIFFFLEVSAENSYKPCIYGSVFFLVFFFCSFFFSFFSLTKNAYLPSVFFFFFEVSSLYRRRNLLVHVDRCMCKMVKNWLIFQVSWNN